MMDQSTIEDDIDPSTFQEQQQLDANPSDNNDETGTESTAIEQRDKQESTNNRDRSADVDETETTVNGNDRASGDADLDESEKLVIDTDHRSSAIADDEQRRYDGTILYDQESGSVYLIDDESDVDSAIQRLPIELRSTVKLMNTDCDQEISSINVISASEEQRHSATRSSSPTSLIRCYEVFNFDGDRRDIPSFSLTTTGEEERILMCLECKLWFEATKPFVNHAVLRHELVLLKEEEELLAPTTMSAVLRRQKSGPSNETRLYFLRRPNNNTPMAAESNSDDDGLVVAHGQGNSTLRLEDNGENESPSSKQETLVNDNDHDDGGGGEDTATNEEAIATADDLTMDVGLRDNRSIDHPPAIEMTPADIARTVMLASELSASRLLQQVSRGYHHQGWNADPTASTAGGSVSMDSIDRGTMSTTAIGGGSMACGLHSGGGVGGDGKSSGGGGVECPKCDVVLGSSRSLGGHMTMTHSRNSCKTLKCPKCNWHYKYPETLEIHMKEKHPENEVNCVYCITNQAHPRLSRGETYTCGYKPFRCDICKYSTTTKGNLSIHMQSDKHLNNVQELQQGKLMTQAQAGGSLAGVLNFGPPPSMVQQASAIDFEAAAAGKAAAEAAAAMALAQACAAAAAAPSPKLQPTTAAVKNKPSWRCDVCNYETNVARNLRIHMTSEKHAHNMTVLQQSMKQLHQTMQGFSVANPISSSTTSSSTSAANSGTQNAFNQLSALSTAAAGIPQQLQASTASYFPAHHHSMANSASHHQQQQQRAVSPSQSRHLDPATAFGLQAALLQRAIDGGRTYQCCVCMTFCSEDTEDVLNHIQRDRSQPNDGDISVVAGQYYCNLCRYKTHLKANFQLHTKTDKHLQRLQLVNHVREGCPESEWRLKYLNPNNPVQLRCCACNHLVNSFHKLQMHSTTLRHKCFVRAYRRIHQVEEERRNWTTPSQQQQQQIFYCTLCDYGARTRNGILSHLHSEAHSDNVNRLGPLMDLSESSGGGGGNGVGGGQNESDAPDWVVIKNASELDNVQLAEYSSDNAGLNLENNARMNECSEAHRRAAGLVLEWNNERALACDEDDDEFHSGDEAMDESMVMANDDGIRCCSRCSCTYETEAELLDHYASSHAILKQGRTGDGMDESRTSTTGGGGNNSRFGGRTSGGNDEATMNYDSDSTRQREESSGQAVATTNTTVACPLCQQDCGQKPSELMAHLAQVHNVSSEGITRLLSLIPKPPNSKRDRRSASSETSPVEERPSSAASSSNNSDKASSWHSSGGGGGSHQSYTCPSCSVAFKNLDDLYSHQTEVGHIEMTRTPQGIGYLCWSKGCNQYFETLPAIQSHYRDAHAKRQQQPVGVKSDRHAYPYRCNRCSQAYPTMEKLQQHQLYHQMRASTTCALCSRTFRTIARLKEHVESTHVDNNGHGSTSNGDHGKSGALSTTKIETDFDEEEHETMEEDEFEESPSSALVINESVDEHPGDDGIGQDELKPLVIDEKADTVEDYLNSPAMAESAYNDPSRKFKCHRCRVAFTRQSYLSVHNRTVAHRRGDKVSFNVEKYLDPSRPFKCDVCRESFTQKNILLVHNNSVSHMRKFKQALQETYPNGDLNMDLLAALSKGNNVVNLSAAAKSSSPSVLSSQSPKTAVDLSSSAAATSSISTDGKSNITTTNSSNNANKRFKCNTCDIYVTESTREIHFRSVKHQSRAAKMSGGGNNESDLNHHQVSTMMGDQQSTTARTVHSAKQLLNEAITKRHHHQSIPTTGNKIDSQHSSTSSAAAAFSAHDAAAAAAASFQSAAALLSMAGFGPFLAAAQAAAYQELPGTSGGMAMLNEFSSQMDVQKEKDGKDASMFDANGANSSVSSAIEQVLCNSRFVRSGRGSTFRRLLENYGFEVVMQFNEMQPQKRIKLDKENTNGEHVEEESKETPTPTHLVNGNQTASTNGIAPVEFTKCACPQCDATFSSVWVLKAHVEQTHGTIVPSDYVEETSEEFKQAYEKKYLVGGSGANQQDVQSNRTTASMAANSNENRKDADSTTTKSQQANSNQQQQQAKMETTSTTSEEQMQQQQQMLALNAMMQQFSAAAQFPAFASNPAAAAAAMGMGMPFMGMQFPGFNPFLPMMVSSSAMDQFGFGMTSTPSTATSSNAAATTSISASSSVLQSNNSTANLASSSGFAQPTSMPSVLPSMMSQAAQNQQQKRARTRITDDQLKVLREYFDINNSPTEEQIEEMSRKSGLALKVIKHWFRNTLFKERQRCKDSPYNFNIPPSYSIDLEEYEKTGEAKITRITAAHPNGELVVVGAGESSKSEQLKSTSAAVDSPTISKPKETKPIKAELDIDEKRKDENESGRHSHVNGADSGTMAINESKSKSSKEKETTKSKNNESANTMNARNDSIDALQGFDSAAAAEETLRQLTALGAFTMQFPNPTSALSSFLNPQQIGAVAATSSSSTSQPSASSTPSDAIANLIATAMSPGGQNVAGGGGNGGGRRANRTRFTEFQIRALQEFFEKNAYPKDDDLEFLSQKLSLSPRVIVVWFQNARQKARKVYENHPPEANAAVSDERFHRTPGLNYQCKGCKLVFQRYYELIKHQKTDCYRDEGGGDFSTSPTPTSSASTTPKASSHHHGHTNSDGGGGKSGNDNEYRCVQCNVTFNGLVQFTEHMKVHASNPMLFMGGGNGGEERSESAMSADSRKRGFSSLGENRSENVSGGDGTDSLSDDQDSSTTAKRSRSSQILPEQLDALYKKYEKDANPSSRNLEKIAQEIGANKQAVQSWFQNTRARDRRGQLNDRQFFNKRCPFCGILHHSKQTMEVHLHNRHADQMGKTEVNIDTLPDAEEVPTITTVAMHEALLTAARCGGNGNELAQSMLSFGMVPGTTTVPGPGRTAAGRSDGSGGSTTPLDLSRAMRGFDSTHRPSSVDRATGSDFATAGAPRSPSTCNSNEEAMSMDGFDDSVSAFDHDSPSPHQQVLAALARPQKRFRTHLTGQQVKVMKHLFQDYKTPTMAECETLGQEIGLHKRVVQVWFQNARAKERKAKQSGDPSYTNSSSPTAGSESSTKALPTRCDLCSVTYNTRTTMQDHLFGRSHLEKVRSLAERDGDDSVHGSSPKYINDQRSTVDERPRSSQKLPAVAAAASSTSSSSSLHQSRSQQKQQAPSQKRNQPSSQQQQPQPQPQQLQSSQDTGSSPSNSSSSMAAQNFLPYMYAAGGLPQAYYAGLASSMMYSGAFPGMYDPNLHGTPVNMLQIPMDVMKLISTSMNRPREASCRFTQDGMTVAELSKTLNARDRSCLVGVDLEVGWACRRCTTVFQTEALFLNHQRLICQSKDPAFKLVQTHYECRICGSASRFGTQEGYKQHCQSAEHITKMAMEK